MPLHEGKGKTAEAAVSSPVIWLLGFSRICCRLSHQWSAITGYGKDKMRLCHECV